MPNGELGVPMTANPRPARGNPSRLLDVMHVANTSLRFKPRETILMNEFRKLGFLERHRERDGGLHVHRSLLRVVLQD